MFMVQLWLPRGHVEADVAGSFGLPTRLHSLQTNTYIRIVSLFGQGTIMSACCFRLPLTVKQATSQPHKIFIQ